MKKVNFKKTWSFLLVTLMCFALTSCSSSGDQSDKLDIGNQQTQNQESADKPNTKWDIKINGKSVTLPCTLAELAKIDVNIYGEVDKENVLNSSNETFTMIAATYSEEKEAVFLKIVTGGEPEKKEENATVTILVNTEMDSSLFKLKNDIAIGSFIDDVISAFGDDYNLSGATSDDIHSGYTVIHYGTKEDGAMFNFQDGVLEYIEISADKEE